MRIMQLPVLAVGAALVVAGLLAPVQAAGAAVAAPRVSMGPDVVVGEGDGFVDVPVRLSAASTSEVRVSYNVANNTAGVPADYSCPIVGCAPGTLIFAPGVIARTIRVPITDDAVKESLESFTVNVVGAPVNASVGRVSTRVSIADNDAVVATPALFVRDAVVDEGVGTVDVPVVMGGAAGSASAVPVTVHYVTSNVTAAVGSDYLAASGTLTFAPGETVQTIPVRITNDAVAESSERLQVVLSGATHATIGDATGTVTIGASDGVVSAAPRVSMGPDVVVGEGDGFVDVPVTLSAPSASLVRVNVNVANNTAGVPADYSCPYSGCATLPLTFAPGQTTQAVRIDLFDDAVKESLESFTVNVVGAPVNASVARPTSRVTIRDND